jgi:hypothetical protein
MSQAEVAPGRYSFAHHSHANVVAACPANKRARNTQPWQTNGWQTNVDWDADEPDRGCSRSLFACPPFACQRRCRATSQQPEEERTDLANGWLAGE